MKQSRRAREQAKAIRGYLRGLSFVVLFEMCKKYQFNVTEYRETFVSVVNALTLYIETFIGFDQFIKQHNITVKGERS